MASSGSFYTYTDTTGLISADTQGLLTQVQNEYKDAFGDSLSLAMNSPQGVLINAEVLARGRVLQLNATLGNQLNPQYSGGVFLDSILALTNSQRSRAAFTIVPVILTGVNGVTIPQGSLVQDTSGNMYSIIATVTLSGQTNATVQAVASGPTTVAIGAINSIVTNILGWETVNNPTVETVTGSNTQSDNQARTQRNAMLALQGQSLSQAITSGISSVPGVSSLFYRENVEDYAQNLSGVNLSANSIYACVDGGDPASIASVMNFKKSGGCNYNNAVLYTGLGTTVGSFTVSGTTAGPFTIASAGTTINTAVITVSSTAGVFAGQTISGAGIPAGALVLSFVANTSITMSALATATASVTITMGGSAVVLTADTTNMFIGQTVAGTGIPLNAVVTDIVTNTSFTMSIVATASGTNTLTMGNTAFITGISAGFNLSGTTVGPFTRSGAIVGVFTISSAGTVSASNVITVSSTTDVFVGQTVSGAGIPLGATVIDLVLNTSITISANATATATITITMGGSKVITIGNTSGVFFGQTLTGTGIPLGATVVDIDPSTSITMSVPATTTGSPTITFGGSPVILVADTSQMFIGQGVTGSGIPVGSIITDITTNVAIVISQATTASGSITITFDAPTLTYGGSVTGANIPPGSIVKTIIDADTIQISNLVTGSGTNPITIYGGIPKSVPVTDPYSGQTISVLFDQPATIQIAVKVTAKANSSLQDIIGIIQTAVVNYANGLIENDAGLTVGTPVSCFDIAGAINITAPTIFVYKVETALLPLTNVPFSSDLIEILPYQKATIVINSVTVDLLP